MKKIVFYFTLGLSFVFLSSCNVLDEATDPAPANNTGSISAKFNGTSWSGSWATSLIATFGNTQVLTINGQVSENVTTEVVAIGISSFTGVGTYNYGGTNDKVTLSIKYQGKNYTLKTLSIGGGGGTGTIKITEFVRANGILNPGKAVGEFSGTIVSANSSETLTITNGKFNSVIVL